MISEHDGVLISNSDHINPRLCKINRDETRRAYIINDGATSKQWAQLDGVYDAVTSFEFVLILHIMREIMEITDDLCQALQRKSQDIVNTMNLVSTTKILIQKFWEYGWVPFLEKLNYFVEIMI